LLLCFQSLARVCVTPVSHFTSHLVPHQVLQISHTDQGSAPSTHARKAPEGSSLGAFASLRIVDGTGHYSATHVWRGTSPRLRGGRQTVYREHVRPSRPSRWDAVSQLYRQLAAAGWSPLLRFSFTLARTQNGPRCRGHSLRCRLGNGTAYALQPVKRSVSCVVCTTDA